MEGDGGVEGGGGGWREMEGWKEEEVEGGGRWRGGRRRWRVEGDGGVGGGGGGGWREMEGWKEGFYTCTFRFLASFKQQLHFSLLWKSLVLECII